MTRGLAGTVARLLPSRATDTVHLSRPSWVVRHREKLWLVAILLVAALAHGINMFDFPHYDNDEGTHMSRAWSLLSHGDLASNAQLWDRAPAGWIQLAGWVELTGGFRTFDTAINSGRVLMLLVQVACTLMVYLVVRSITSSPLAATIACLTFALSAYGLYYHRRVLPDNLASLWMLASLLPLVYGRPSLKKVWLSALALAISILSKESTVFLLPVLAYLVFYRVGGSRGRYAAFGWTAIVCLLCSTYYVVSASKGGLFATGARSDGSSERVGPLGALTDRASDLLHLDGGFWQLAATWARTEPFLVIGGTASAALAVLTIKRHRLAGLVGLATVSLWASLALGGTIFAFYLVPLLPLLAISAGLVLGSAADGIKDHSMRVPIVGPWTGRFVQLLALATCVSLMVPNFQSEDLGFEGYPLTLWTNTQAEGQLGALDWTERNIPEKSNIVTDNSVWVDLRDRPDGYENALNHWEVELDPKIRDGVLHADWRNIDYLYNTVPMDRDIRESNLELVGAATEHSSPVARFDTGGYPVEIRRVDDIQQVAASENPLLTNSWAGHKRSIQDGQVVEPQADVKTTSEGQAYALLRAVYMGDRHTFDQVWRWTEANLQREDGLLAWHWGTRPDGSVGVLDKGAATDADVDAAVALLFASRVWDAPEYRQEALEILDAIWRLETSVVAGRRILVAGDWARGDGVEGPRPAVVNPSYFAPYAYRIFAEADPEHRWTDLVDSSYGILQQIRDDPALGGAAGLVPNWITVDPYTGELLPADAVVGAQASQFSYDACRVPWRLSLDWFWYKDPRAREAIRALGHPERELRYNGRLLAGYYLDGSPAADYEAIAIYAGVIPGLLVGDDPELAHRVFAEKLLSAYVNDGDYAHWGEHPDNLYEQNMAWFATAVMDGGMSNLWEGERVIDWYKSPPVSPPAQPDQPQD